MNTVEIEALRPFNRTPQGDLCEPGDRFPVGEVRAEELERLGLAKPTGKSLTVRHSKLAPEPANKMAPAPANKRRPPPAMPEKGDAPKAIKSTMLPVGEADANPGVRAAARREAVALDTVARQHEGDTLAPKLG